MRKLILMTLCGCILCGWANAQSVVSGGGTMVPGDFPDRTADWYVSKGGDDSFDGRAPDNPMLTIQAAFEAGIGTGSRTIYVAPGNYGAVTNFAAGENVTLLGSSAKNTTISSLTVATNHQGVTIQSMSFYAVVTVGNQFYMQAGTPKGYEVLLQDVSFIEVALTSFTDSPVKCWGGTLEMKDVSFIALAPNFNGMGTGSGDWMSISNSPDIHLHGTHFTITDMVNTNISVNMVRIWDVNTYRDKNTSMDITWSGPMHGEIRGVLVETNTATEILIQDMEFHVVGDDDTVGEAEGIVGRGNAFVRSENCSMNISGFLDRYSYETYDAATMTVNGASDVGCTYKEGVAGSIKYTGSPEDGQLEFESAAFKNGQPVTDWPQPSGASGNNGIGYISFGQLSEIVSGENETYNNMTTANDGDAMPLMDTESKYMNITMTITNWNKTENNGQPTAGALFPEEAVRGNIESLDGETARVVFTGVTPNEEHILRILGSSAHGGKDCDDMWYWIAEDPAITGSVTVVDNTSTLVTLTNTPTGDTITLMCKEQNGDDAFLNAMTITGPAASGYVRTDGESTMSGDLDMGGKAITDLLTQSDGVSNTTAATTAFVLNNAGGGGGSGFPLTEDANFATNAALLVSRQTFTTNATIGPATAGRGELIWTDTRVYFLMPDGVTTNWLE